MTEHSQGTTAVMALANLAMATGNIGRPGVGVNPLRGQNNVQGSCDMGSFPHELPGYRHISEPAVRAIYEREWGVTLDPEPGLRIPNMIDAAIDGSFRGIYIQGEDIAQSDPDTQHITEGLAAMEFVVVHDLFLNETANYAHVFLPGSTFLEKDGTFINAERRINLVRKVMAPRAGMADWEATQAIARAMGLDWNYTHPSQIMDEIARTTPTFAGVIVREAGARLGPVAVQREGAGRHAGDAYRRLRARHGQLRHHRIRADRREDRAALPDAADDGPHPDASTTSARRRGARRTWCGTTRTCWRSIRTMPNSAACAMAIWCGWRRARARRRCARRSPIAWRRAWSTRRSIIRRRRRMW